MPTASWNRLRYTLYASVDDLAIAHLPFFWRGRRRTLALAPLRPGERVLLVAAGTGLDGERKRATTAATPGAGCPVFLHRRPAIPR